MKMKHYIYAALFMALSTTAFAQKDNRLVRQGNKEYDKQNYTEAETSYLKALDDNYSSVQANYNLGATRYRQDSMKQAVQNWSATALNQENNADLRSQSFYNIGNAMMKTENYQESIEFYKQSLRLNPNDDEARYNLAYAQQMLKQQQQDQQGGGNNNDQKKDQKKDQNKDQQQNQDQQDQQDQQNQQGQDQQDKQQQQQSQQQHQQEISKEEAERMLEAMKNNEKKTLDKVKQQQVGKPQKTEKDW
jgi:tetratricopeptide (TPR) repeat protein